jgi:hypothetical protein
MLLKEVIAVYIENRTKHTNKSAELLIVKVGGTVVYYWALEG